MGVSKVEYSGNTLIDLTGDTVTPDTLLEGATAHDASGEQITGTAVKTDNNFTDELKEKLEGIAVSADAVSFSQDLSSGTKVGTIIINGTATDLYAPAVPSISGSIPSTVADNTVYTFPLSGPTTIAIPTSGMVYSSILRVTNANYITWSGATHYNGDEPASGEVWEFSVLNGSVIGLRLESA